MKVIYLNKEQLYIEDPICVALGFFDGLHKGHMALVDKVIDIAREKGYKKALMTFDHHPLYVLGKIEEEHYLTSMSDRIKLLEDKGMDYLFVICFDKEVASLSPQDFIDHYLKACHVKHVVCGYDFRFASHNQGDIHTLKECPDFDVSVIDKVLYKNEKISSSRIRSILDQGSIDDMNELLGRHYCICGHVISGRHIGHTIGFPTANVDYGHYYLPRQGVYITKVYIDGQSYMGMCNIGYNPTFDALSKPSLEVYILDFSEDIYHKKIKVEFYKQLRLEKKFSSCEELIEQLKKDKDEVKLYFQ
jgi:riboflavin kinase/FMN adenylyltransferase